MFHLADTGEEIGAGLEISWVHDGKILQFAVSELTHDTLNTGAEILRDSIEQWPIERPYLLMLDTSRGVLTPYGKTKMVELGNLRPELKGRVAVIVAPSAWGHMTSFFVNRVMPKHTRERRVFFNRDVAMQWLEELL